MKQRLKDAILLEMSFFSESDRVDCLFHTNRKFLELAIEQLEMRHPNLADVIFWIEKLSTEYRFTKGSKWEMILRLLDLEEFIKRNWKFI